MYRSFLILFSAISTVAHAQVPNYVPSDGLIGWWAFNGTTEDLNGSEMTFVFNGSTDFGSDRFGGSNCAISLEGDGSAVATNDGSIPQYGELSVSYWVNRTGGSSAVVALGASNGGSWKSSWGDTACNIRYADGCGNSSQDNVAISNFNSEWKHVVMTSDGLSDLFQVFVDGEFIGSGYSSNGGACSVAALHLGVEIWSLPEYFIGSIDELGIWNRVLNEDEISTLFSQSAIATSVDAGPNLIICEGDSVTLSASGGSGTYSWNGDILNNVPFIPDSSGVYYVVDALNPCSSGDSISVEILPISSSIDSIVACDSLTWLDGITYTSNTNDVSIALSNAAGCDSIITLDLIVNYTTYSTIDTTVVNVLNYNGEEYTEDGEYTVNLENEAGCDSIVTIKLTVENVAVYEFEDHNSWKVYPNPTQNSLQFKSPVRNTKTYLRITNVMGQEFWREWIDDGAAVNVRDWGAGTYFIQLFDQDHVLQQRMKIIIE